jgi:hypothetical protein
LPACSHRRCARSLISCSVGSDNGVSSRDARPTWGGRRLGGGPCRPAIGGDSGPPIQASSVCGSS